MHIQLTQKIMLLFDDPNLKMYLKDLKEQKVNIIEHPNKHLLYMKFPL